MGFLSMLNHSTGKQKDLEGMVFTRLDFERRLGWLLASLDGSFLPSLEWTVGLLGWSISTLEHGCGRGFGHKADVRPQKEWYHSTGRTIWSL